jgi:hypothetical protein
MRTGHLPKARSGVVPANALFTFPPEGWIHDPLLSAT